MPPTIDIHDVVRIPIGKIHAAPWNANVVPPETLEKIRRSLKRYGAVENNVVRPAWCIGARTPADVEARRAAQMEEATSYETLSGNHRLNIYREEGVSAVPCAVVELSDPEARVLAQVLNRTRGSDDPARLADLLKDVVAEIPMADVASLLPQDERAIASLIETGGTGGNPSPNPAGGTGYQPVSMVDQFIVPPFSVLDARQGYWRERKRAWISLGIRSELGRDGKLTFNIGPGGEGWSNAPANWQGGKIDSRAPHLLDPARREAYRQTAEEEARQGKGVKTQNRFPTDPDVYRHGLLGDGGRNSVYHGSSAWAGYRGPNKKNMPPRKAAAFTTDESGMVSYTGTSIFDPVLCELAYRWFTPPDGVVLDPFAGGSVRGVVAALLGRRYVGIDIRAEQIGANIYQWAQIRRRVEGGDEPDNIVAVTPVESAGGYWFKRDDRFCVGGVQGGKVRTCWHLAQGAKGLVTAGSRMSPQCCIVAHVAKALGIPCRIHVPSGDLSPELVAAQEAGAEVIQHRPGYNSVIIARAKADAEERGWTEIPFGMECEEAVRQTATQAHTIPAEAKRLVVPVGSGMSLAGILTGMKEHGINIPVLGVQVGADPTERLDRYAPEGWREMVTLVKSDLDYHAEAPETVLADVKLDPIYEAKCIPFMEKGDCLWCVGIRKTAVDAVGWRAKMGAAHIPEPTWITGDARDVASLWPDQQADFIFSCPPYADLEVYSDDPRDLSTLGYDEFIRDYGSIIKRCADILKEDRFACFVVGDLRDDSGCYRNFPAHTIQAFEDAGLRLYNEAVLVTSVGSLPLRAGRAFRSSRKLGKGHQNVLVFVKGDPVKAAQACGSIDVTFPGEETEGKPVAVGE